MDTLTPQINQVLARWSSRMPALLPDEDQLTAEYRHVLDLLATDPPEYQAGRLRVSRDRIAQARRMYISQAA